MSKGSYDIVNPNSPAIQERVSALLSTAKLELILCYGIRRRATERWSAFNDECIEESVDMDVLIVIQPSDKHREHELVEMVNQLNTVALRLVPLIHNSNAVKEAMRSGNRFFRCVFGNGVLVYQSTSFQRSEIPIITSDMKKVSRIWQYHHTLARQFLAGAQFHLKAGQYSLTAFMLHQATERICSAAIQDLLGYRVTTHNINRLLSLTENISVSISEIFPRSSEEEKASFGLLSQAYSHVRYNESFEISENQATELYHRVTKLIETSASIRGRFMDDNL